MATHRNTMAALYMARGVADPAFADYIYDELSKDHHPICDVCDEELVVVRTVFAGYCIKCAEHALEED